MLRIEGVRKSYGATVAVDGLSLTVQRGEVLGLLGPNGAGKSTTVAMAVGMLRPDAGRVSVGEFGDPFEPTARAKIGVAPQSLALYDELSASENLDFFGRLHGLRGAELKTRIAAALDFVELSDRQGQRVKTFSGGMKRRLNLATAILHEPPVVLLDEPTVGVDPQSRAAIFQNISRLKSAGCAILFTTHQMDEAQQLCDRVAIVDHGKLLDIGSVGHLIETHGGSRRLRLNFSDGREEIRPTADPLADLAPLMPQLSRFSVESPSLEDVFLNLTGRHLRD